jgi:chloride channel protein, CIC family
VGEVAHTEDVVARALDIMMVTGQGRVPVTDPVNGALVGLLTRRDLLQFRVTVVQPERERQAFLSHRTIGGRKGHPGGPSPPLR